MCINVGSRYLQLRTLACHRRLLAAVAHPGPGLAQARRHLAANSEAAIGRQYAKKQSPLGRGPKNESPEERRKRAEFSPKPDVAYAVMRKLNDVASLAAFNDFIAANRKKVYAQDVSKPLNKLSFLISKEASVVALCACGHARVAAHVCCVCCVWGGWGGGGGWRSSRTWTPPVPIRRDCCPPCTFA